MRFISGSTSGLAATVAAIRRSKYWISTPVPIAAGTVYVASYHTNTGFYAGDNGYFAAGVDNGPLHALQNGVDGGNGVYAYGSDIVFPTNTYKATNYWVDVVFKAK